MNFFANFRANERNNRAKSSRKLRLEALENRELLSADGVTPLVTTAADPTDKLTVTTLEDVVAEDGFISLREAIAAAVTAANGSSRPSEAQTTVTIADNLTGKITLNSPIDVTFTRDGRSIYVDGKTSTGGKIEVAGQINIYAAHSSNRGGIFNTQTYGINAVTISNFAFVGDDGNVDDYVFYKNGNARITIESSIIQHYNLSVGVVSSENTCTDDVNNTIRFRNSVIYKNTFTTSEAQVVNTWYKADGTYAPTTGYDKITIHNCTITDNICTADNGYMFTVETATNRTYAFYNTIVYANKGFYRVIMGQSESQVSSSRITLYNMIFEADASFGTSDGDINTWYQIDDDMNVKVNNQIVAENVVVCLEGSFLPDPNSYAVDRGNNGYVTDVNIATDIAGNPRVSDARVDIGAYEGVFNIPKVAVTIEDDIFAPGDDFNADGTINSISLREAFLYTKFFNIEKYQDLIVIENLDSVPAIMRSFDRDNPDPDAPNPYFSRIEFAANVENCTLTLGEPIEVHRNVTLVGKNRGGVDVTVDASANNVRVYDRGVPGHEAGEYFKIEYVDMSQDTPPVISVDTIESDTTETGEKARIFTVLNGSTFTVTDVTFQNASQTTSLGGTGTSGGVFYISEDSKLEGQNLTFTGNSAAKYGGAIFNKGEVELAGTTKFEGNSAALGGAVYNRGTFTVYYDPEAEGIPARTSVSFKENEAKGAVSNGAMSNGSGAAIYNTSNAIVNVSDATFDQNTADKYGGAISNFGILNVENADFLGNTAGSGGAIQSAGSASVVDAVFTGNNAVKRSATLSGSDFGGNGGAIFASNNASNADAEANLTLTGAVEFYENTASNAGGALDFISGSLTFESADMVFNGNSAGVVGGAIVVANDNIESEGSRYTASNNETGFYAKTIAANCSFKSEAASNIKEAFGLITSEERGTDAEYSIPRSEFDTFVRYKPAMGVDSQIEFSYLASMLESEPEYITVYYGSVSIEISPESDSSRPSYFTLGNLGITEAGTYPIKFYVNDAAETAFTLNVSLDGDNCMMARMIDLTETLGDGVVGYTFKSYAEVAVSSWTVYWGDEDEGETPEPVNELGYYLNQYHWYDAPGTYQISLKVTYADSVEHTFESIATYVYRSTNSDALLDEVFLTGDFFADEDSLFDLFK